MLIHITKPDEPPVTRKFEQKDLFWQYKIERVYKWVSYKQKKGFVGAWLCQVLPCLLKTKKRIAFISFFKFLLLIPSFSLLPTCFTMLGSGKPWGFKQQWTEKTKARP
jgi:hypothetical protein